tara:strand:+ start:213 stop:764 length:552 start_codon:yes stop_codon:yes gene_type:complete
MKKKPRPGGLSLTAPDGMDILSDQIRRLQLRGSRELGKKRHSLQMMDDMLAGRSTSDRSAPGSVTLQSRTVLSDMLDAAVAVTEARRDASSAAASAAPSDPSPSAAAATSLEGGGPKRMRPPSLKMRDYACGGEGKTSPDSVAAPGIAENILKGRDDKRLRPDQDDEPTVVASTAAVAAMDLL